MPLPERPNHRALRQSRIGVRSPLQDQLLRCFRGQPSRRNQPAQDHRSAARSARFAVNVNAAALRHVFLHKCHRTLHVGQ